MNEAQSKEYQQKKFNLLIAKEGSNKMKTSRYILYTLIKIMAVFFMAFLLFFVGLMIGYGVIGDGSPMDVFQGNLWGNIFRFLN